MKFFSNGKGRLDGIYYQATPKKSTLDLVFAFRKHIIFGLFCVATIWFMLGRMVADVERIAAVEMESGDKMVISLPIPRLEGK